MISHRALYGVLNPLLILPSHVSIANTRGRGYQMLAKIIRVLFIRKKFSNIVSTLCLEEDHFDELFIFNLSVPSLIVGYISLFVDPVPGNGPSNSDVISERNLRTDR